MSSNEIHNLNETIAQALQQMKAELGDKFSLKKVNLAELSRRTGISRKRLRNAKKHGFRIPVHGNTGRKKNNTVLTGYTAIIDILLRKGVTNSNVILERLQDNLFIGMIHAFQRLGVPATVLTDNMKSIVTCRDSDGHPVWSRDYEAFMKTIGFTTKLCKPRHPFTKGYDKKSVM